MEETIDKFKKSILEKANHLKECAPQLELGQAVHVVVYQTLGKESRTMHFNTDCFFDDSKIDSFLTEVFFLVRMFGFPKTEMYL